MSNFYAALEIGTTRTVLAIGEAEPGGRLKISCHAEIPSSGIRKSQILDINQAMMSIKSVIHSIEDKQSAQGSKVTIANAYLVVSGQHIKADHAQFVVQVDGSKVGNNELEELSANSQAVVIAKGREILDIIEQDYELDSLRGIASPKGMAGRLLRLNTLQIHADADRVANARTAAGGNHLEISEPLFATSCAAEAVLEAHEKKNGVLVLDLGGGSTGYTVYLDGYIISAGVIGVGGDHITSDISHAFQTTNAQAEELKISTASALVGTGGDTRVKVPGSSPLMETRTISRHALNTVVNARLRELFTILRETLESQDLLHRLHAGVVITGGGAAMQDIESIIEHELGMPARTGKPIYVDGIEDENHPESFAAIAGALMYAHHNEYKDSSIGGFIRGLFK